MPTYRVKRYSMANAAMPGMTRMAATLGQTFSPGAQQKSYEDGAAYQSKIAQTLAQIGASEAAARAHDSTAQLNGAKGNILSWRPDVYNEQVASAAGTDVPTVLSYRNKLDGTPDSEPMGPPTEGGDYGATPKQFAPEVATKIAGALRQFMPLLTNTGDINPEQLAKATGEYRDQGLSDQVIAGKLPRNTVAGAQAAASGKALFHEGGNGAVLDLFGGQLDTSSPMAQATIAERNAAARRNDQQGTAAVTRANRPAAPRSGGRPIIRDTPNGLMSVDPETGVAAPVLDENGNPIAPKSNEKPMTEGQAKANLFGTRMKEADSVLTGLTGKYSPEAIIAKSAAGNIPLIGGVAGWAANAALGENEQKAEQAQRDFINAVLRRESGAVINPEEFDNARKQYFPQPGDSKAVIDQKARNRKLAIDLMLAEVPESHRMGGAQKPGGPAQAKPAAPAASVPGSTRITPAAQAAKDDAAAQQEAQRGAVAIGKDLVQVNNELARATGDARSILMQQKTLLTKALRLAQAGGGAPAAPAAAPAAPAGAGGFVYLGKE